MNRGRLLLVVLAVVAVLATGCQSFRALSPYDQASLAYVQSSVAYEAIMPQIVAARAAHRIDDATWSRVDAAQRTIARVSPMVRTLLVVWKATRAKPAELETYVAELTRAIAEITAAGATR